MSCFAPVCVCVCVSVCLWYRISGVCVSKKGHTHTHTSAATFTVWSNVNEFAADRKLGDKGRPSEEMRGSLNAVGHAPVD